MDSKTENSKESQLEKELDSLSEELINTYQEMNLLYRVSEKLGSTLDIQEIAEIALDEILSQIPVTRASIMLLDEDSRILTVLASIGLPPELGKHPSVKLEESVVEYVIAGKKPLLVDDVRNHPTLSSRLKGGNYNTNALISVPIMITQGVESQKIIGAVTLTEKIGEKLIFSSKDLKLLTTIASHLAIAINRSYLFEDLINSQKETEMAFYYTVETLARAAEANDEDTGFHISRVGTYAKIIAEKLELPDDYCQSIYYFAQLHDVGKLHIHPDILRKPGKLTDEEFAIIKGHPEAGAQIIGSAPMLRVAKEIALSHHERFDGTGYPGRLTGDQIPISGRITMLADIYDALRNARSYKPPFSHEKSFSIITKGDGRTMPSHFDPRVLDAFEKTHEQFEKTYEKLKDFQIPQETPNKKYSGGK